MFMFKKTPGSGNIQIHSNKLMGSLCNPADQSTTQQTSQQMVTDQYITT